MIDRRTPGLVGRRRPASSRDSAFQKPDTPPTPSRDARRRRLRSLLSQHRWHVGSAVAWRGRDKSLDTNDDVSLHIYTGRTQQIGKQSITVLWKEAAHPQGLKRKIAGPSTRMSCMRTHWPRSARRGERARVVLPFPLPNCFNKMEIAQPFKLVSHHLK